MDSLHKAHKAATEYVASNNFEVEPIGVSTINKTYIVKPSTAESDWFILQRMHSIFTPNLMENIERVTAFLNNKGMKTPVVLRTLDDRKCVEWKDEWWRALSYVPGVTVESVQASTDLGSVGELVGKFHTNLLEYDEPFSFTLENFHNTEYYMRRLMETVNASPYKGEFENDAAFIVKEYQSLAHAIGGLPKRVIHADLKISNIRFNESGKADTLIDLDTLMSHHVAVDLGDGLRSWCALGDEDTPHLQFDRGRYRRALDGYFTGAEFLSKAEKRSIPFGLLLITLELSARFITDACLQNYFLLQEKKYPHVYEQNKTRAGNQLSLYKSMKEQGIGAE